MRKAFGSQSLEPAGLMRCCSPALCSLAVLLEKQVTTSLTISAPEGRSKQTPIIEGMTEPERVPLSRTSYILLVNSFLKLDSQGNSEERRLTCPRRAGTESSGMCQWGRQLPLLSLSWHGYDPSFCISIKRKPSCHGAQQSPPPHLAKHQVASKSSPFAINCEISSTGEEATLLDTIKTKNLDITSLISP
ncbi:hypothetical protein MJG53_011038 [Ovis ammon polii x Ovis aries]|uniref:Uncharacterized protein n=1 Tax=Ovis ammon polii x Ovis aries TaxID=2918886 RepID=A0ACB9URM3_9CETA|nr:hypothetical protein MJG53_011038 [Ovis ammon polii x Ovis aries]